MSEIVPKLFGLSPEAFKQQRQDLDDERALAFAQLDPFQRASLNIQRGADRLAGVVGGMLGGQDPELQRRTQAQQIFGTIDPSDPDTFLRAAEMALQGGDQQLAFGLRNEHAQRVAASQQAARDAQESDARIFKDLRGPSPTGDVARGIRVGEISKQLENPELNVSERNALEAELRILDPKEKPTPKITIVGVAVNTKKPVYLDANTNEQFTFGAGPDGQQMRVPYVGAVDRNTSNVDVRLPDAAVPPKEYMNFMKHISGDQIMEQTSSILSAARSTMQIINDSNKNDFSYAALGPALARISGEGRGKLAQVDIKRFARTGGFSERVTQDVVKFFSGRATGVTKDQAQKYAAGLFRGALLERKAFMEAQAKILGYDKTPNHQFAIEAIDNELSQFTLVTPGAKAPSAIQPPPRQAVEALKNGEGTDKEFDETFGPGAAQRAKGGK